jgi:hypothetical protein
MPRAGLRHVVAGAAADQRHERPGDRVGAAHHLLLVTAAAVAEQQHRPVLGVDVVEAGGRGLAGRIQIHAVVRDRAHRRREARPAERVDHHPGTAPVRGELARSGTADHQYVAAGRRVHRLGHLLGGVRQRGEHDHQGGPAAAERLAAGLRAGLRRVGQQAAPDPEPTLLVLAHVRSFAGARVARHPVRSIGRPACRLRETAPLLSCVRFDRWLSLVLVVVALLAAGLLVLYARRTHSETAVWLATAFGEPRLGRVAAVAAGATAAGALLAPVLPNRFLPLSIGDYVVGLTAVAGAAILLYLRVRPA